MTRRSLTIALLALVAAACTARRAPDARETSGFLDDYARLRPGQAGEVAFVYRNADADWTRYRKIILEPITLWRSGKDSLAAIPEEDLLRLVSSFDAAVRRRIGDRFEVVDEPAPGTLLLRLAITEARASDPLLDVLTATPDAPPQAGGELGPELRRFIDAAAIEGELRDAETNVLLAQGLDRRRESSPRFTTWSQLDQALDRWVDRLFVRLERRTGVR